MRRSKRSLEGELLIDHRNSPGLRPDQVAASGLEAPAVAGGETYESAIVTCAHCQVVVVLNPDRTRDRGWCPKCDKYLCDACQYQMHRTLECRSATRRFDELQEAIERFGVSPLLLK